MIVLVLIIILLGVGGYFAFVKKPAQINDPMIFLNEYRNDQYGFGLELPNSWNGFTVLNSRWEGRDISVNSNGSVTETGPIITLRHPQWTQMSQREDMPIMVFTTAQWTQVESEKVGVSAAPFPPSVLAKNSKYVLALPPRYNYDYKTGYEEVDVLVHTLQAFEPK